MNSPFEAKNQNTTIPDPFSEFRPFLWTPESTGEPIYSVKRNHGITGTYKLHNLNDQINDNRITFDKVIVEYVINDCSYVIFTVADLLNSPTFDQQLEISLERLRNGSQGELPNTSLSTGTSGVELVVFSIRDSISATVRISLSPIQINMC